METIKTAFVVLLLLAVLYGVYVVLNKPELKPPPGTAWEPGATAPPEVDVSMANSPGAFHIATAPESQAGGAVTVNDGPAPLVGTDSPQGGVGLGSEARPREPVEPLTSESGTAVPPALNPVPQEGGAPEASNAMAATTMVGDQPAAAAVVADEASGGDGATGGYEPSIYAQSSQTRVSDDDEVRSVRAFDNAWNSAVSQLEAGQWAGALFTLSFFYDHPDLTPEERTRLVDLLDPLAGKVIYSGEHILEAPYEVRPGETLQDIADHYQVPARLLQSVNGIADPDSVEPGTQLKVVRGPFRAEIDLQRSELTLFLGKYYAGRFPISIGNDPKPQPGEYDVQAKQPGHPYATPDGSRIPPSAPDNPYGPWWLDLGGDLCVHASPESLPSHGRLGCVSLKTADAADVYGILSVGSKVVIR